MQRSNKPAKPPSVRTVLLASARAAGYHDDMRALVRLIVERGNRITQRALRDAYSVGARIKAAGQIQCDCFQCKKAAGVA